MNRRFPAMPSPIPTVMVVVRVALLIAGMTAISAVARATGGALTADTAIALAKAVALAATLRPGRRDGGWMYLGVAVGLCIAGSILGFGPGDLATQAIVGTIEVVSIERLIRALSGHQDFRHLRALLAMFAASFVGAVFAAMALGIVHLILHADRSWTAFLAPFGADVLAFLIVVPILLTIGDTARLGTVRSRFVYDAAGITIFAALATTAVFVQSAYPLLFVLISVTMLAAFRLMFAGTALVLVVVAVIASIATALGHGPVAKNLAAMADRVTFLQFFLAVTTMSTLPVAAILSERERLGARLAESERRLRRLAQAAPIAIFRTDVAGVITFGNEQWRRLAAVVVGDPWLATVASADAAMASAAWAKASAAIETLTIELSQRRAAGDTGTTQFAITPEYDEIGHLAGWIGIATDVEERRRAENRVVTSERLYRLLADNSNDMIVRVGLDGIRRFVSPASQRILGYSPEEMIGETPIASIHPEDRARVERVCRSLLEGAEDPVCTYRQRRADGSYANLEATYRLLLDSAGAPIEFVASVRDVGRRQASECAAVDAAARLEESHRLLTMAEAMAGVGHWRVDAASSDVFWSPEVYAIHGLDPSDREALSTGLAAYHPEDRDMVTAHVERGLAHGAPWSHFARIIRPDGDVRHISAQGQAEHAPDGSVVGLVGVFQDVTDRVLAEAALVAALDDAHALANAKSVFLATMSHEIRTPLTGVLGMIELLRSNPDPVERDRFLDSLEQSASLLTRVLDDVLDFSKIESGNLVLEAVDFDLALLAQRTVDLFLHAALTKGLTLSLSCPQEDMRLSGDPTRLQQVLSNLISNAIKFTDRGAIELRLAVWSDGHRRRVRGEVADTGIGLDDAQRARLFEPFVQADPSTTRRFGGTGLGLAITRRLVLAMDGIIGVYSAVDEGSTFWFEIALDRAGIATAMPRADRRGAPRRLSVLLAEDNPVNQLLVSALVQRDGHDVLCVANGRLAVAAAQAQRFDAILMDMQMPELDGIAATRAIRAGDGPCAAVPIIALTADASIERRQGYEGAGLTAFLTKPVDTHRLTATLDAIGVDGATPPDPGPVATTAFDEDKLSALKTAIGAEQTHVLLQMLADEARNRPDVIDRLVAIGDLATAASEGHALKGAAFGLGAVMLGDAARMIEQIEQAADPAYAVRRLRAAALATLDALERARS